MPDKAEGDKSKTPNVSRLQKMRDEAENQNLSPEMPPCDAPYLIDYLYEIGPTMAAGMGNGPLTAGEIESWERLLGIEFQPWESRLLRRLSVAYCNESAAATSRDCPPPWKPEGYKPDLSGVAKNLEKQLEMLMEL